MRARARGRQSEKLRPAGCCDYSSNMALLVSEGVLVCCVFAKQVNTLRLLLEARGLRVWYDNAMLDRSTAAMVRPTTGGGGGWGADCMCAHCFKRHSMQFC